MEEDGGRCREATQTKRAWANSAATRRRGRKGTSGVAGGRVGSTAQRARGPPLIDLCSSFNGPLWLRSLSPLCPSSPRNAAHTHQDTIGKSTRAKYAAASATDRPFLSGGGNRGHSFCIKASKDCYLTGTVVDGCVPRVANCEIRAHFRCHPSAIIQPALSSKAGTNPG